jgi:hypothetical protein
VELFGILCECIIFFLKGGSLGYGYPRAKKDARHADVIVVGAGILGTFHAYFASKKGYRTLLLECNPFPNDASTRNFGMIVQTIVAPVGRISKNF